MSFKQLRLFGLLVCLGVTLGWYEWPRNTPRPPPARPKSGKTPADINPLRDKAPTAATSPSSLGVAVAATLIAAFTGEPPVTKWSGTADAVSTPGRFLSTEEVVARTEGSVALVRGEKAFGTGFMIRPGILVTNAHVIALDPMRKIKVIFTSASPADREPIVKGLLWEDVRRDLAFLSVDSKLAPLDIESTYKFRRGQEVTVIGNPGTGAGDILENAVSRGVMSTLMTHKNQTFFQMSVSINPGNSGGPVIGSEGRVIGVATLKSALREGIAGCIPVGDLASALKRVESLPRSAFETSGAIHDIRTAITPLEEMGVEYAKTLDTIARLMDEGASRGIEPARIRNAAVRSYRRETGDRLHRTTVTTLYPALCRADSNSDLPAAARKPMHDLWQNLLDLQKNAESPQGTGDDLHNLSRTLGMRHEQLADQVREALESSPGKGK